MPLSAILSLRFLGLFLGWCTGRLFAFVTWGHFWLFLKVVALVVGAGIIITVKILDRPSVNKYSIINAVLVYY